MKFPKFEKFRLDSKMGGGDLVMKVLTVAQYDEIADSLEDASALEIRDECIIESIHSIAGAPFGKGVDGIELYRGMGNKKKSHIVACYNAINDADGDDLKAMMKGKRVQADGSVLFQMPARNGWDAPAFAVKELRGGQVDDITHPVYAVGYSAYAATTDLEAATMCAWDGVETNGDSRKVVESMSLRYRAYLEAATSSVNRAEDKETRPLLASAEPLYEAPKTV